MGKVLKFQSCAQGGEHTGFGAVTPTSYGYIGTPASYINTFYNSDPELKGKVTGIGNGWQKYVVENSGTIKFTVRGAAGGNTSNPGYSINPDTGQVSGTGNKPGRGAKLQGSGKFKKGDILYILVGMRGWCNTFKDWGGGGGGASVVLLDNPSGKYTFAPLNRKVDVLFVAGGGGGSYDDSSSSSRDGTDAVITDGTDTSGGSSSRTGGGAGLTGNGGGSTQGTAYNLLSGTPLSSNFFMWKRGGWGGGGDPYNGGGGGGGYSGGSSADTRGGYGGTSYINPDRITESFRGYATVAEDSGRNLTNPWTAYGHVELITGRSEHKYILAEDSDGYKWFNGTDKLDGSQNAAATEMWELLPDQKLPEELTYMTYGDTIITTDLGLQKNAKFLIASDEPEEKVIISAHANGTVVKQNKDVSLSDISLIKDVSSITNLTNLDVRFAISKNSGLSWQTYTPGGWVDIDITDKTIFQNQGYDLSKLSTIPIEAWNSYKAAVIEFAFCITQNGNNGNTIIDSISLTVDLVGSWRHFKEAEATYEYISDTEFKVTFHEAGNYKVNYLDTINTGS